MDSEKQERYEKYKKRRRRATGLAVALLLVVPMVVLSIASLIKPDVKFSAEENRILTQRPKLNPETLKSKSFMEGYGVLYLGSVYFQGLVGQPESTLGYASRKTGI